MNADETAFRLICAGICLPLLVIRRYYEYRGRQSMPAAATHTGEHGLLTAVLTVLVWLFLFSVAAYIADPTLMAWSAVPVQRPIRWAGAALGVAGILGEIWTHVSLGKQFSGFLRITQDHVLVTYGPYAWIRHPMYSFGLLLNVGVACAAANWFILAAGVCLTALLMVARTPLEEAMLTGAFGDSYRNYMERTGRFLPRLR